MKITYEHLFAVSDEGNIRANVIYQKIGNNFIGSYFGYEGGGSYSDGLFWINEDEEIVCDWDTSEFPEEFKNALESLAQIRRSFESDDEEGWPSEKAIELRESDNTNEYEYQWEYWSDNCDLFVIVLLSSQWGVSIRWHED